jgi:glycosyltransferase involved in cell wall biosynthesis
MTGDEHVSVIIPTYYRNGRLTEAIESVLRQDYPTCIIVVDDSGENHAESVTSKYPEVEYIALDRNRGQNTALNKGLQEASGKYIQFLDDDDILLEGKLKRQIDVFKNDSETGVVYCGQKYVSGEELLP